MLDRNRDVVHINLIKTSVRKILDRNLEQYEDELLKILEGTDVPDNFRALPEAIGEVIYELGTLEHTPIQLVLGIVEKIFKSNNFLNATEEISYYIAFLVAFFEIFLYSNPSDEEIKYYGDILTTILSNPLVNKDKVTSTNFIHEARAIFKLGFVRIFNASNIRAMESYDYITDGKQLLALNRILEFYSGIMSGNRNYATIDMDKQYVEAILVKSIQKIQTTAILDIDFGDLQYFLEKVSELLKSKTLSQEDYESLRSHLNNRLTTYFELYELRRLEEETFSFRLRSVMALYGKFHRFIYKRRRQSSIDTPKAAPSFLLKSNEEIRPISKYLIINGEEVEFNEDTLEELFKGKLDSKDPKMNKKIIKKAQKRIEAKFMADFTWNSFATAYKLEKGICSTEGLLRDPVRFNELKGSRGYLMYQLSDTLSLKIELDFDAEKIRFSLVGGREH